MATLNVKNFPEPLYERLKDRARKDGRSLSSEVEYLLAQQLLRDPKYTLADWQGVGAEIWKGVDADAFVRKERKSWGR